MFHVFPAPTFLQLPCMGPAARPTPFLPGAQEKGKGRGKGYKDRAEQQCGTLVGPFGFVVEGVVVHFR